MPAFAPHPRPSVRWFGLVAFVVVTGMGVATSAAGSYSVRAATAIAAAVLLVRASGRADGLRLTRRLVAGALLTGAASGAAATVHVVVTGDRAGVGSWVDWLQLGWIPLAVAALFAVPTSPGKRYRIVADAAIAAGSLWYVTMALIVEPGSFATTLDASVRLAVLGYVLGGPFVIAVLLSVVAGASSEGRAFLVPMAGGVVLLAVADLAFALAAWQGAYDPTSWIAVVHQAGLAVLLGATASSGRDPGRDRRVAPLAGGETPDAVLPYAPLAVALVVAVARYLEGTGLQHRETLPVLVIGAAVLARHAAAVRVHALLVSDLEDRERLARLASRRDPLTSLANRTAFVERLGALLQDPAAHPVAVAVLDLNDFKHVNDNHGHDTGDRLLQVCAQRLSAAAGPGACVARLGGDEFAVCRPGAGDGGQGLVEAIVGAFEHPVALGHRRFSVHPSVGVVIDERAPDGTGASTAAHLLAHADVAMYQAKSDKEHRSNPAVVLTGEDRSRAAALIQLREEISQPSLDQFSVVYQPIVDLGTGAITGVEALLRWLHPTFGEVSPTHLVGLAEQVGSIGVLGHHVLSVALADLAGWHAAAPGAPLTVSVNLSPRELSDPDLAAGVGRMLAQHGVAPSDLVLEITEGALMRDFDTAVRVVADLRAAGVAVAVDDFGTGYSSLRYLRRFVADTVKIDREFITAVPTEPRTATLVRLVVEMADALGLRTVAEGIETPAQLAAAQAIGCDLGQGFLFSEPVPALSVTALVTQGHRYPMGAPGSHGAPPPGDPHAPHRLMGLPGGHAAGAAPAQAATNPAARSGLAPRCTCR